jgi:group II intron reverse transcriptase/maturase
LEDKIVQRAVTDLLEPIYEATFYGFSHGFRPGRSAHGALASLRESVMNGEVRWVVDADIEGFFDHIDHGLLQELIRRRVNDRGILRLIGRWLKAGILDGGAFVRAEAGTPQGGVVSPLLANIYLHYALDEWYAEVVRPRMRGRSMLVRYGDDFVAGFELESDARRFLEVLGKRLERFHLRLHPEKTRLIDFSRGQGGTFAFLGFCHYWGRSRRGHLVVKRRTARDRIVRFLRRLNHWCRANRHAPLRWQYEQLSLRLRGHFAYFGVRCNMRALEGVRFAVERIWHKWLCRRSQRARMGWARWRVRMQHLVLPFPRIVASWV